VDLGVDVGLHDGTSVGQAGLAEPINTAPPGYQRWEDYRRRMEELPRRPPRAAGHDAP
jgi:hypothetical protein